MIRQHFLSSCAVAAFLCGFSHAVFAAGTNMPTADWAVGPILAKGENGSSYCSMKNTYQSGQMLVFARDGSGSNSIALDFKRDTLEVGRQYPVTVRAGLLVRQATAIAATRQVLITQMGVDKAFYSGLTQKSSVSFDAGTNSYVFSLDTAIPTALKALEECVDSLQSKTKFAPVIIPHGSEKAEEPIEEAAPTVTTTPEPKVRKKSTKIRSGVDEVPGLASQAISKNIQDDIDRLKMENRKLALKNQEMQGDLLAKETDGARGNLRAELDRLKAENDRLARETQLAQDAMREVQSGTEPGAKRRAPEMSPDVPAVAARAEAPLTLRNFLESSRVLPPLTAGDDGAYRWQSGDIFGAAQELPASGKSLPEIATYFIEHDAAVCKGDFAQKMGSVKKAGNRQVLEAEMICLNGQEDPAAAVLFVQDQDRVSIVTHESSADQMGKSLSKRDVFLSAISGGMN